MSTGGPVARGRRALACAFACVLGLALTAPQGAAAATPYQTAVLGSTPSSYLRLGESTGTTAANEVAAAASGTYGSGVTLGTIGADSPNPAVQFGGTGYVTVPDGTDTGPTGDMALEAWVKPASVGIRLR